MKIIGILATVLTTLIVTPIWRGFVLCKLWTWFVVSTFGVVALNIPQAIGISLISSFLTYQYDEYEDKEKSSTEKMVRLTSICVFSPAFALLIGWIVKGFLG